MNLTCHRTDDGNGVYRIAHEASFTAAVNFYHQALQHLRFSFTETQMVYESTESSGNIWGSFACDASVQSFAIVGAERFS